MTVNPSIDPARMLEEQLPQPTVHVHLPRPRNDPCRECGQTTLRSTDRWANP
jgi:hypothetical protein